MRIGIVSDIHDNLWNLRPVGLARGERGCRDLLRRFVLDVMDELRRFGGPVHIVFGNNDAVFFGTTTGSAKSSSDERWR